MLNEIMANKLQEIEQKKRKQPVESLQTRLQGARAVRDFHGALSAPGISLIAEIKRKSPSKGEIRANFDPIALGRIYSRNGARAISVLADEVFFGGGAHIVERVANDEAVDVPVMYKEFVIDPYQIYEARSVGADAVLLIVRCIEKPGLLAQMIERVHELGMHALVECFTTEDAAKAIDSGARIIGINNRDLQTFEVDMKRSEEIRSVLPSGTVTVSESGLSSRQDALQAEALGFDAMLVGEALLKSPDIENRVREFTGLDIAQSNNV